MKVPLDDGVVYLRDRLDFAAGHAIRFAIVQRSSVLREEYGVSASDVLPDEAVPDLWSAIAEQEILRGVESWSFKEPVTRTNIRSLILDDPNRALAVANAANELYYSQVIDPLARSASNSSPDTQSNGSTSPPNDSSSPSKESNGSSTRSHKRQKPSRQSSTTTTPMEGTVTITSAPVGASSS